MIKGIRDVYYNVKDMNRAVTFYTEVLGLRKIHGDEYWTSLETGGTPLGLHGTEGGAVPAIPKDEHGAHAGATVTFSSDDIKGDRARLEKAGIRILGENDAPWGHMLIFEDLDGNVLKLMNPK